MDKKTKVVLIGFSVLAMLFILASYWKYFLQRDYIVIAELPCDPENESCFVHECDPSGEECDSLVDYYKFIEAKAYALPLCDPNLGCLFEDCREDTEDCRIIKCDPDQESCISGIHFSKSADE